MTALPETPAPSATRSGALSRVITSGRRLALAFIATLVLSLSPVVGSAQSPPASAERPELKVGDRWKTDRRDLRTNAVQSVGERVVTAVAPSKIDVSLPSGPGVMSPDLTMLDSPNLAWDPGYQFLRFPIEVGKKWDFKTTWHNKTRNTRGRTQMDVEVKNQERIKVPAGEFDAFKIEARGFTSFDGGTGGDRSVKVTYWYAPKAKAIVRLEWIDRSDDYVSELLEFTPAP